MNRRLAFILTPEESFTPTRSGAIATHTYACCRQARAAGYEPVVFARPCDGVANYGDVQVVTYAYPPRPIGGPGLVMRRAERRVRQWTHLCYGEYVKRTVSALREHGMERSTLIIHNDPELVVLLRQRFPKARLIHWFHNQHGCKPRRRSAFGRCVDASIAVSDFIQRWTCEYYGLLESRVHRVYNGVDTQAFCPCSVDDRTRRSQHEERPIINFTGRTGIEKAPDLVLSAALELSRRGATTGFGVQIIGANHWGTRTIDRYQCKLDGLAGRLRADGISVEMPGHLDRTATARRMQQADIHVVPSRWDEPFGLTTVEGMACGLATIGSRTGGTPEIIDGDGLLFERDNVEELADHLERLILHPDERQAFGRRARQRSEQFTWDRTWAGLERVLMEAA